MRLSARARETLETSVIFLFALAFLAYLQFQTPFLPDTDGYYHIKNAWMMRHYGLFHGFKWASQSLWRDRFSDTSLLFHLYLMPFTFATDLAMAGKWATVLLASACFTSFYLILKKNDAPWPAAWFFLLCSSGPLFLWRMSVPRPQILSVTLLLWCVHFLLNRRRRAVAVLSFFYALSYAAAFMPVVFALMASAHRYLSEKERDWLTPAAAFAGFALALLINPYFPNDLLMLYVQNFYVLVMSINGGGEKLSMGGEFYPTDTRRLLMFHLPLAIVLFAVVYFGLLSGKKAGRKAALMLPFAAATIAMTMIWKRFTEYSVPLTVLFCALRAGDLLEDASFDLRSPGATGWAVLAAGFLAMSFTRSTSMMLPDMRGVRRSNYDGSALYLKSHLKPGEAVFTCDWDEAPELYFFDHAQRYLVFMDPVFMYYFSPTVWRLWNDAANGRLGEGTGAAVENVFKARYGVCRESFGALRKIMYDSPKMKVVYDDGRSWVFDVSPKAQ